ncbi:MULTISPECIES: Pam3-gp28 family putative phage holin [Microvirga]|jgi:hypothetical protein|uniref:Pam3-gp28 family putative phage holin n=1 Tax=Microvirga TaxID=186650 RepID=UPI0021C58794|nr:MULTISPECIES: hypothetical protein [unclassified Microvirga]
MTSEVVKSLARQVLTIAGSYLVAKGYVDAENAAALAGAVATIASVVWSVTASRKRAA